MRHVVQIMFYAILEHHRFEQFERSTFGAVTKCLYSVLKHVTDFGQHDLLMEQLEKDKVSNSSTALQYIEKMQKAKQQLNDHFPNIV